MHNGCLSPDLAAEDKPCGPVGFIGNHPGPCEFLDFGAMRAAGVNAPNHEPGTADTFRAVAAPRPIRGANARTIHDLSQGRA